MTRDRDRSDECALPAGELELRSRPWNTILPDAFMRGESTDATLGGGGVEDGRRRAGLWAARAGAAAAGAGEGEGAEAASGGCG